MSVAAPVSVMTDKVESSGLSARGGLLQRKLRVGASNDPLEWEADQVADQLLGAPAPPNVDATPPRIRRSSRHSNGRTNAAPASVDRVLATPGTPLEPTLREDLEQHFGHDFARVRVHADAAAERSASDLNANAYTVGHDIVFGAGRYRPGAREGRRLLAHELTHVVQQSSAASGLVQCDLVNGTMAPSLELTPGTLTFDPTEIGKWSIRHVTLTNRSDKPVHVDEIRGPVTVEQHPPSRKWAQLDTPSAPWPATERVGTGPFEAFYPNWERNKVRPGALAMFQVNFSPNVVGHAEASLTWVEGQRSLGTVFVSGDGKNPEKEPDENAKVKPPDDHAEPSGNTRVDVLRLEAMSALTTWVQVSRRSIGAYHLSLMGEWAEYLSKTASNPSISSASLPGGPSMLAHIAEHTIAGLAVKGVEHVIEHTAEHMAEHAVARAIGAVGAGEAGAGVGALIGPVGAVIGFAVGVLIETIAGDLFETLTSEDAELRKALQEEFQHGFDTGAEVVADLFNKKVGEQKKALAKALTSQEAMENEYKKLVLGATRESKVDRLHAEIEAQTDLAKEAVPSEGFGRALLALWARDHAGTGRKEVPSEQLENVSLAVSEAVEQPDLFVSQCLHEWRKRGLPVTQALEATMMAELSRNGVHKIVSSGGHEDEERAMALGAQMLFSGREFVWKDVQKLEGFGSYLAISQLRPEAVRHNVTIEGGDVYCAPILVVDGASCSVSHFAYRVKHDGLTLGAYSSPGDSTFQAYGAARPTGEDAGIEVYDLMRTLRGIGVTIEQRPDALYNHWLQQRFGAGTAIPKLQETGGQPSRVAVFESVELLDPRSGGGVVPDSLFQELASTGAAGPGNSLMIRGGDTILVLHGEWK